MGLKPTKSEMLAPGLNLSMPVGFLPKALEFIHSPSILVWSVCSVLGPKVLWERGKVPAFLAVMVRESAQVTLTLNTVLVPPLQ